MLIVARLEEFAYGEATAIAVVLLVISFAMLLLINLLERWSTRHEQLRLGDCKRTPRPGHARAQRDPPGCAAG